MKFLFHPHLLSTLLLSYSQRLCSSSGRIQRAFGADTHTTLISRWSTTGWKKASSCCRKPLSRPAALHSGCQSPGSTERACDPRCFPSTVLQTRREALSSTSRDPHAAQNNSLPLLLHRYGLNWLMHTQGLQISTPRATQGIGASHGTVMQCYINGYSRAQGTPYAQNTAPCLSRQQKAQSCCSTWPIFSASVPSGRVGAFQADVLC